MAQRRVLRRPRDSKRRVCKRRVNAVQRTRAKLSSFERQMENEGEEGSPLERMVHRLLHEKVANDDSERTEAAIPVTDRILSALMRRSRGYEPRGPTESTGRTRSRTGSRGR